MPLDKFILMLIIVVLAAGVTVWVGVLVAAAIQMPAIGWIGLVPAMLIGYIVWRVIADRITSREDDHYDHIDK